MKAEPPLSQISYVGHIVEVYPVAGVDWKTLIDLRGFGELRPGMTFVQAKAHLGPPDLQSRNSMGPYIAYRRPWGNVQVGYERQGSGGDFYEAWSLRAYPDHSPAKDFLHPAILKYLDPKAERMEVFLIDETGRTALQVILLRDLRIHSVNWFRE